MYNAGWKCENWKCRNENATPNVTVRKCRAGKGKYDKIWKV